MRFQINRRFLICGSYRIYPFQQVDSNKYFVVRKIVLVPLHFNLDFLNKITHHKPDGVNTNLLLHFIGMAFQMSLSTFVRITTHNIPRTPFLSRLLRHIYPPSEVLLMGVRRHAQQTLPQHITNVQISN